MISANDISSRFRYFGEEEVHNSIGDRLRYLEFCHEIAPALDLHTIRIEHLSVMLVRPEEPGPESSGVDDIH